MAVIYNQNAVGITGLYYDSVELSQYFLIQDLQLNVLPTLKNNIQTLAQKPGSYFESQRIETRKIQLKLKLNCGSRDPQEIFKCWREAKQYLYKTEPKLLYLNEWKHIKAILAGETPLQCEGYYGIGTFNFVSYDPFFYGDEHTETMSGTSSVTIAGEQPVFPKLTLTASSSTVKVTNQATGEFVSVPNVASGATVVVDMGKQLTTVNGNYAPVALESDYFQMSGTQSIKVEGATGNLKYTERYL